MGDLQHCERALSRLLEIWPDYAPARMDLADTLSAMGRRAESDTIMQTAYERQATFKR